MAEPGESAKEELELTKLRLEIAELTRPWWRRTSALTSFLPPLIVALLSVGVGWWTGFFDNQRLALEAKRDSLEAQTRLLKIDERELTDKKSGLQAEIGQLRTQIGQLETDRANEREGASVERDKLRETLSADIRQQRAKAATEITALKKAADETREAARRTPATVWLDVMTRKREKWQIADSSNAAEELLKVLTADPSLVPVIAAAYEKHSSDDSTAAKLLRILYTATGDSKWLERIAVKLAENGTKIEVRPPDRPFYWASEYGYSESPYWRESMLLRLRKRDLPFLEKTVALAISGGGNSAERSAAAIRLANSFEGELGPRAFGIEESYFALLRLARDSALVRVDPWRVSMSAVSGLPYMQQEALEAVERLSTEGAIAILATLISGASPTPVTRLLPGSSNVRPLVSRSPSERDHLENEFRRWLARPALKAEAIRLGLIEDESGAPKWQEWIRDHQGLLAEWTERDLTKLRQRLSRRSALFPDGFRA